MEFVACRDHFAPFLKSFSEFCHNLAFQKSDTKKYTIQFGTSQLQKMLKNYLNKTPFENKIAMVSALVRLFTIISGSDRSLRISIKRKNDVVAS